MEPFVEKSLKLSDDIEYILKMPMREGNNTLQSIYEELKVKHPEIKIELVKALISTLTLSTVKTRMEGNDTFYYYDYNSKYSDTIGHYEKALLKEQTENNKSKKISHANSDNLVAEDNNIVSQPRMKIILRWIGILPGAIGCYILAFLIFYYGHRFFADANSWDMKYFAPMMASLMAGIAFTYGGMNIAPSSKKNVGLVLVAISLLACGAGIYMDILQAEYFRMSEIIVVLFGSIIGYAIGKSSTSEK